MDIDRLLQKLFFGCIVRPVVSIVVGINLRHGDRLPNRGPAIIVANHNSHLDTAVLMSLFPLKMLPYLRPVAAADYFLRNGLLAWFSTKIMGIIPIARVKPSVTPGASAPDSLAGISEAIGNEMVVIFYPEGTRGEAERMGQFKSGIALLAKRHPEVPIIPVFLHGLGKSLPRGEALIVPFFCDAFIGEPLKWNGDKAEFLSKLQTRINDLALEGNFPEWE